MTRKRKSDDLEEDKVSIEEIRQQDAFLKLIFSKNLISDSNISNNGVDILSLNGLSTPFNSTEKRKRATKDENVDITNTPKSKSPSKKKRNASSSSSSGSVSVQRKTRDQKEKRIHTAVMSHLESKRIPCAGEVVVCLFDETWLRLDVLTDSKLIEIKTAKRYVDAFGQILRYRDCKLSDGTVFENHALEIMLFGCSEGCTEKAQAKKVYGRYETVPVTFTCVHDYGLEIQ